MTTLRSSVFDDSPKGPRLPTKAIGIGLVSIALLVFLVLVLSMAGSLVEYLDANQVMLIQSVGGKLTWYTDAGYHWQGFGRVVKFDRQRRYWFSNKSDQGDKTDQSIQVRFRDGGHANLSGSIAWEVPTDNESLTKIYRTFGTNTALEQQLVRTVVEKSVYMTGPLMTSKESYAEKRNDLISYIEDQISNGVYRTVTEERKEPDPITGEPKTVSVVRITVEANGQTARQEPSPLREFGIRTYNLSINNVVYDQTVDNQIKEQQQLAMQVQTSIATAKQAEQRAITVAKEGEASAAEAKWKQEVVKAQAVTEGEQKLAVATLDNKSADQYREAQLKRADADATYRRRIMEADGALEKKLATWLEGQKVWAAAFQAHQGQLVPSVIMGGTGGGVGNGNAALNLMDILGVKAARDLSLDLMPTVTRGKGN